MLAHPAKGGKPILSPTDLYHDRLLALARHARQQPMLSANLITHRAETHNPTCGDRAEAQLCLRNGKLLGAAIHSDGCAICQAAAGLLLQILAEAGNASFKASQLQRLSQQVADWLADKNESGGNLPLPHPDITLFTAVKTQYRNRMPCVRLPFEAAAMASRQPLSGGR